MGLNSTQFIQETVLWEIDDIERDKSPYYSKVLSEDKW
jgi:hypothetical protein